MSQKAGRLRVGTSGYQYAHWQEICSPDWGYWRFHGVSHGGHYTQQTLMAQARSLKHYVNDGLDVFVYFNNDAQGYAVQNAMDLRRYAADD